MCFGFGGDSIKDVPSVRRVCFCFLLGLHCFVDVAFIVDVGIGSSL